MPELWIPSGGTNRKIKELYIPSGGVTRKIKAAYAPSGGANRKIFSGGIRYWITTSADASSDWAASTFTLNGDASGKMYAFVANGGYFTDADFSMVFNFQDPILKSNLPSTLLSLDYDYDKRRISNDGAWAYLILNGNTNAKTKSKTFVKGTDPDQGSNKTISWAQSDMTATAAALTYISSIELKLHVEMTSSRDDTAYLTILWGSTDIWLLNKWIGSRDDYIQI
ncbi:hypothetical protein [Faecalispora jeddahensis]|uniref:hypothetical protein n=1 Tax=Faecalispora jeddahensis TaxID=1414721 RepID=UPI00189A18A2|nr:hypothetical protein [Faecalispora jeddahensis]